MANQEKPDVNTIWASSGEATAVPIDKQALGYVEEIPFFDDFNGHMQQISKFQQHVNQEGIPRWDPKTAYNIGSSVKSPADFNIYRSLDNDNVGNPPISDAGVVNSKWVRWSYTLPELSTILTDPFVAAISYFATLAPPPGWLLCNGAAVSRSTYARLFAQIGTYYGAGNGTTTFNVPETRGEFSRAADSGRGVDIDRVIGSPQTDMFKSHVHSVSGGGGDETGPFIDTTSQLNVQTVNTAPTGGIETRPRNIAFIQCIKF